VRGFGSFFASRPARLAAAMLPLRVVMAVGHRVPYLSMRPGTHALCWGTHRWLLLPGASLPRDWIWLPTRNTATS